jgi:hypothetical protein
LPHTRQFVTTLPPAFGNGKPQEISSAPGNITVMIKQVRDDFLHPDVRPTLFDTHRLGAASDVYLKGHSGRDHTGVGHDSQTACGPRRLSLSDLREARARPNRTGGHQDSTLSYGYLN